MFISDKSLRMQAVNQWADESKCCLFRVFSRTYSLGILGFCESSRRQISKYCFYSQRNISTDEVRMISPLFFGFQIQNVVFSLSGVEIKTRYCNAPSAKDGTFVSRAGN